MGDGLGCTKEFNLEEFCRKFKHFPVPADSALKILTQAGYIEYTDEQDNASRIIFTIRRDELYNCAKWEMKRKHWCKPFSVLIPASSPIMPISAKQPLACVQD